VQGQTFEQIESGGLLEWLEGKTYTTRRINHSRFRRVLIPKPGGGARPLGKDSCPCQSGR
jgi:RNA-directed DNA polymerase